MKNKLSLLLLASIFALSGCTFAPSNSGENGNKPSENTDIEGGGEEEKPEEEHEEEHKEPVYVSWPTEDAKIIVQGINPKAKEIIPAFNKATKITVDWDLYLEEGYFGIYCETEDSNSENEYKTILKNEGWDVVEEKVESYFDAFSPYGKLRINFGYDASYKELQIYITEGFFIHWPEKVIKEYVSTLVPEATSVIPLVEATSYVVNIYDDPKAIAINVYGLKNSAVLSYKSIVEKAKWTVEEGDGVGSYWGYSPDEHLKINFYYDETKSEFNIDIFKYEKPVTGWPYEEISSLLTDMGLVGEVLPYRGANNGFEVDPYGYPPAIYVYVNKGTQEASAKAYNQMLLDSGYVVAGTVFYGATTVYTYPGTTLAYAASYLAENCITIELFSLSQLDK